MYQTDDCDDRRPRQQQGYIACGVITFVVVLLLFVIAMFMNSSVHWSDHWHTGLYEPFAVVAFMFFVIIVIALIAACTETPCPRCGEMYANTLYVNQPCTCQCGRRFVDERKVRTY